MPLASGINANAKCDVDFPAVAAVIWSCPLGTGFH